MPSAIFKTHLILKVLNKKEKGTDNLSFDTRCQIMDKVSFMLILFAIASLCTGCPNSPMNSFP